MKEKMPIKAGQAVANDIVLVNPERNLTGKIFTYWTVLSFSHRAKWDFWNCQCKCGTLRKVNGGSLRAGQAQSCGCIKADNFSLVGQRFGRLVAESPKGPKHWWCICDCGNRSSHARGNLTAGTTKSCGCLMLETVRRNSLKHGKCRKGAKDPTYRAWAAMIQRCTNPNQPGWEDYGGRGITVTDDWLNFENFLRDMGERPGKEYSVDRKDNSLGYSKDNCKWSTRKEQTRNKRNNRWITFEGRTQVITDWGREFGILHSTIDQRLKRGWSLEDALKTPVRFTVRFRAR